jgi:DNA-binding response OmpR family regulator
MILSDRRMPGTSGDELLARVRNHGIEVPFVMVSAVDSDVDLPDGLTEYFTKPVAGSDLIACVEQHVSDPVAMQESHSG